MSPAAHFALLTGVSTPPRLRNCLANFRRRHLPHLIAPSPRLRRSPYYDATVADGAASFAPYNHMLMPCGYGDPIAEYDRLLNTFAM